MQPLHVVVVLTVLAAVDIVLTRVRLGKGERDAAGRLSIPQGLLNTHTGVGLLALAVWTAFLVTRMDLVGWAGLALWWIVVVVGLLILLRWLPPKGRHSSGPRSDTWGEGPGLSVLAHVGLLVGVTVFTVLLALNQI